MARTTRKQAEGKASPAKAPKASAAPAPAAPAADPVLPDPVLQDLEDFDAGIGGNIDPKLVEALAAAMAGKSLREGKVTGLPHTHNLPHDVLTAVRAQMGDARRRIRDGKVVEVLGTRKIKRDGADPTFAIVWRVPTANSPETEV